MPKLTKPQQDLFDYSIASGRLVRLGLNPEIPDERKKEMIEDVEEHLENLKKLF